MRALILTCNTGGGHNSCAKAIQQVFHNNEMACEIADSMQFISSNFSRFISWGHTAMYRHVPGLFRRGYSFAQRHSEPMLEDTAYYKLLSAGAKRLYDYICQGGYDTIICVHVFSGMLLAQMLREHSIKLQTAFVATDYTCGPGAAASHLDRYFIPHEALAREFEAQGIPYDKIVASGIPVGGSFYACRSRVQAKKSAGVSPEHVHLLMMCGSMGCGPLEELTVLLQEQMDDSMELSIVCGTNEKVQQSLEELTAEDQRIHIHGFVANMSELMDSADLYLTKPGGLSTTEAAVKRLPMVLIDAVAGCEAYNMDFFVSRGGAVTADSTENLASACINLMRDSARLQTMEDNLSNIIVSPAAELIFVALQEHGDGSK